MADAHGTVWAVGERECSIQRRHQKIIEEAPSPLVERTPGMRDKLFDAARLAAAAIGYTGAGTVEFLADSNGDFLFLEMNTRLQVEHPVTEATTGLDLVELQLLVADGERLDRRSRRQHADIRSRCACTPRIRPRTGSRRPAPCTTSTCPAPQRSSARRPGPGSGSTPASSTASVVSVHYDPMLAKVISYAPPAGEAAAMLADALLRTRLHGVRTNRDLLVNVLRHPAFLAGATDTAFFDTHGLAGLAAPAGDPRATGLSALAAALADAARNRRAATVFAAAPSGWRNLASGVSDQAVPRHRRRRARRAVPVHPRRRAVRRRRRRRRWCRRPRTGWCWRPAASSPAFDVAPPRRTRCSSTRPLGAAEFVTLPRFPDPDAAVAQRFAAGADARGGGARRRRASGTRVTAGQPLVWLEAMKMEHTVTAPADGVLAELNVDHRPAGRGRPGIARVLARVRDPKEKTHDSFVETDERKALRKAVATMAANYGQEYYLEQGPRRRAHHRTVGRGGQARVHRGEPARGVRRRRRRHVRAVPGDGGDVGGRCALLMMVVSPAINGTIISQVRHRRPEASGGCPESPTGRSRWPSRSPNPTPGRTPTESPPPPAATAATGSVNGQKVYISGVDQAQAVLVVGRTEDAQDRQAEAGAVRRAHRHPGFQLDQDRHGDRQPGEPVPALPRRRPAARRCARRLRGRRDRAAVRRPEPGADHGRRQRCRNGPLRAEPAVDYVEDPPGVEDARSARTRGWRTRWRRTTSRSNSPS